MNGWRTAVFRNCLGNAPKRVSICFSLVYLDYNENSEHCFQCEYNVGNRKQRSPRYVHTCQRTVSFPLTRTKSNASQHIHLRTNNPSHWSRVFLPNLTVPKLQNSKGALPLSRERCTKPLLNQTNPVYIVTPYLLKI
jgi:hypothetical protein